MRKYIFILWLLLYSFLVFAEVNINTAQQEELMSLSGIGPAKSLAIISYRLEHGKFKSIEEIKQVKGIGEGIFSAIKDDIVINNKTTVNKKKVNKKQVTKITQ